jgi:hypothetical protein
MADPRPASGGSAPGRGRSSSLSCSRCCSFCADRRRASVLGQDHARDLDGRALVVALQRLSRQLCRGSGQPGRPPVLRQHAAGDLARHCRFNHTWRSGGYVFAKLPFRGSNALFLVVVAGMFFPPQVILVPLFRLFNGLGLIDTLWPVIIVHSALGLPICVLMMRNFLPPFRTPCAKPRSWRARTNGRF